MTTSLGLALSNLNDVSLLADDIDRYLRHDELRKALRHIDGLVFWAQQARINTVAAMRDRGVTWVEIATVLDVSPQAASKRFGEKV
jgi:hypothetical protein